jgi:tape measure domain-containing protein
MATISNNDIKIRYVVETANLEAAANAFDKLSAEEKQALADLKRFNQESQNTDKNLGNLEKLANRAGKAIVGIFAYNEIKRFTESVFQATVQFDSFQKVLNFTAGSAAGGARAMAFLTETSNRLGISLNAAISGYKTLSGATAQAGLSTSQTQKIFENVAQAVKAFGLSSEDAKGVFLALGQIISKGTVQAEELRGQIGERIPGAFAIAAKAMGKTETELNKMMATGKLASKDFIIPFTDALGKASEAAAGQNGLAANVNKISNAFDILKTRLGRALLEPAGQIGQLLQKALDAANKLLETQADRDAAESQKAYNEALKQTALLSNNALRAQIQVEEVRLDNIKKQFDALQETIAADGEITAEEDKQTKILQEKFVNQKAVLDAYNEELKSRNQVSATLEKDEKTLKSKYEAELKLLEILKEQRILMGELYGDPLARLGADKEFYKEKEKLQKRYNQLFLAEEIKNAELQSDVAAVEFEKGANRLLIARKEANVEVVKEDKDLYEKRLAEMKKWQKAYEKGLQDEVEAAKKAEEEKQAIKQLTLELGQTLVDGAFNLYQANLSNELSALQKRYNEEVRLADGNVQKLTELEEKKNAAEREIKLKQFRAEQAQAVTRIIFETASIFAAQASNPFTAPLAALTLAIQAAQIGLVLAQPVPEFAEGTKGKPFKGGKAIVGERGVEKVVTESGKVYFTPPTATLVDLPKGSQVIPNHSLSRQEVFLANHYANRSSSSASSPVVGELRELGSILKGLPITQLNMDERGFEKFIRTPRRSTKILNNRFGINN